MNKDLEVYKAIAALEMSAMCDDRMTVEKAEKLRQTIEQELKDKENKLAIISEILVDISKGNYSDLNIAIEEIREVL